MTPDPIGELYEWLNEGVAPPLRWAIEHSADGQDPVTAVWNASAHVFVMTRLLDVLRQDEVELRRAMQAVLELGSFVWIKHIKEVTDVLRLGDPIRLPKSLARASKEYLSAIERAQVMVDPVFKPEGRRDAIHWSVSEVANAIGMATEGIAHAPAAHHAVANAIRSQVVPPTFPELIARIERGSA